MTQQFPPPSAPTRSAGPARIITALFDFDFSNSISRRLLKVTYGIVLGLLLVGGVLGFFALSGAGPAGLLVGIGVILLAVILALLLRVSVEFLDSFFRIAEDIHAIRKSTSRPAADFRVE